MTSYDLSHLTQNTQEVIGPVQDDEALLLYALIKCVRAATVLELGGLHGYSATNFLAALGQQGGVVYTVDILPQTKLAPNHVIIQGDAATIDVTAIPRCDVVFYDCHNFDATLTFHDKAVAAGVIDESTILAVHDTGLHPYWIHQISKEIAPGKWMHVDAERRIVNCFAGRGWHAVCIHADGRQPIRHGLTLLKQFKPLAVE